MRNEIGQGMAEAAERGHAAANRAAHDRCAAAGQRAVVGQRLGKGHGDAGADRSCEPDQECRPGIVGGEGRCEQRRQRGDRAIHEAGEARLHILQHEHALGGLVFGGARFRRDLLAEVVGELFVLVLGGGKVVEQIAHGVVMRRLRGAAIEPRRLVFHLLGKFARGIDRQRPVEPDRPALDEAFDVLAADQRQKIAEFLAMKIEQHVAMARSPLGPSCRTFRPYPGRNCAAHPRRSDKCGCPRLRWRLRARGFPARSDRQNASRCSPHRLDPQAGVIDQVY